MFGRRGGLYEGWLKFVFGVVALTGFIHIINRQIWVHTLYQNAIDLGVTASQITLLDSAMKLFLFIALIAGVYGVINMSRGDSLAGPGI